MNIDSIRELKSWVLTKVITSIEAHPNIVAMAAQPTANVGVPRTIAVGAAPIQGGYQLALRVQKAELESSSFIDTIRKRAKNEVDVRYVGRIVKRAAPWTQKRHRPLRIGTSVGHFRITAGTLGCFVRMKDGSGGPMILSNNHVLADEGRGKTGDAILQPGDIDGGKDPQDRIATLTKFVKFTKNKDNLVDCAVAQVANGVKFNASAIRGSGKLKGPAPIGVNVRKLGRTTGLKHGRVTAIELDNVRVGFDIGTLRFDDQIEIEGVAANQPFSRGGDSGSVIFDDAGHAVALLFAGGDTGGANGLGLTYANPIQSVLDALSVELLLS